MRATIGHIALNHTTYGMTIFAGIILSHPISARRVFIIVRCVSVRKSVRLSLSVRRQRTATPIGTL